MTRIFFLPVNTGYFNQGLPDERTNHFYASRSGNGLYCAIVGNIVIGGGFPTNSSCGSISHHDEWKKLSSAIRDQGARAGIQLSTTWIDYQGQRSFRSSTPCEADNNYRSVLTGLSEFTINEIFKNFQQSTLIAANHGFNHIQIHAAHGYLLCIALDPVISPFCDTTAEQLIKWSDYTRQLGLETSIRLSWRSGLDRARDEERQSVLMQLFKSQFSFIDLSAGYYNINKHYIYPQTDEMLSARIQEGIDLANQHPHQDFICSGRVDINTLANWPQNLHAGVCRDLRTL